jgi:HEAT repeat protein
MRERIALAAGVVVLLAAIGTLTRSGPRPPSRRPAARPREDELVKATLAQVDAMRELRRRRPLPAGGRGDAEYVRGLERAAAGAGESLRWLEDIALDRREDPTLRVDLVGLIARHEGEDTRVFLAGLVGDPDEVEAVRLAALAPLGAYRDAATLEVLRLSYAHPAPFAGRYHLLAAMGENGRPEALPLLRGELSTARPPEIRRHAAAGLGGFVDDAGVRAELRRLAEGDADVFVRENALRSLCRSPLPEVDELLAALAASGDEATRRLARAFLEQRGRKP